METNSTPARKLGRKIRVLIADDHPVYREGLVIAINLRPDMIVIGQADNGKQLVESAKEYQPDVVLSDIKMPLLSGIEAVQEIVSLKLNIRCILLSQYDNDIYVSDAIKAGASGYLVKKATQSEIIDAILSVFSDRPYYCRFASQKMANLISSSIYNIDLFPVGLALSDKEKEIISLLCEEKTSETIGKMVFMSARTVEGYKARIMARIGTRTTIGIVKFAIRHGLYNVDEMPPEND